MAKQPKSTTAPPAPAFEARSLGVIGYLADLPAPGVALETLGPKPGAQPTGGGILMMASGDRPPDTTIIDFKDGIHHLYFHSGELTTQWWVTNLAAFTEWAMSLTTEDVVHIHQTGRTVFMAWVIQGLQALDVMCPARKVFIVDHLIETPLYLLVCDDIVIEDTGAITFSNCIPDDCRRGEAVLRPYLRRLYDRAVEKGLLTEAEARAVIEDNAIVFKTARELRAQ